MQVTYRNLGNRRSARPAATTATRGRAAVRLRKAGAEWNTRVELAALYRAFAHFGWADLTYTHIAARAPQQPDSFLIAPYGLLFEEVTASDLIRVGFDGSVSGDRCNEAGRLIHTAILRARPQMNFALHSHTRAGMAVSAMACGLLPLSQHAAVVLGTVAYHDFDAVEQDSEECNRMVADLGSSYLLVLRNHGLLACGRTAGEAFLFHYFLQRACEVQVDALGGGACVKVAESATQKLSEWGAPRAKPWGQTQWEALLRALDRQDRSFRN